MQFNIFGALVLIIILLIQLFIHFVYSFNLKIKYQRVGLNINDRFLVKLKQDVEARHHKSFAISLKTSYFKTSLDIKRSILYLDKEYLDSNIYALVNLVYFYYKTKQTSAKWNINQEILKWFVFILTTFLWIVLMMNFWIAFIVILSFIMIVITIDFGVNYKLSKQIYILTKNYFIENFYNQHLVLILSYLKYKKLFILSKYSNFYIKFISEIVYKFKHWGNDE
ncbi:hypothetical protein ACR82Z_03225 [Mycoplasma sp. 6243]|uniref:hypothetical protein n=1 Tax=Mycoplasma sp. 6243 TaxID=3440865 RepID=UPI003EBB0827